jgi:hypothetical protein
MDWRKQNRPDLVNAPAELRKAWASNQYKPQAKPTSDIQNYQYGQKNPVFLKYQNSMKGGAQLSVGSDGTINFQQGRIPLSRATNTKVQQDVFSAFDTLNRLDTIAQDYQGDYLTYWGKGKAAATSVADKLGVPLGNDQNSSLPTRPDLPNG